MNYLPLFDTKMKRKKFEAESEERIKVGWDERERERWFRRWCKLMVKGFYYLGLVAKTERRYHFTKKKQKNDMQVIKKRGKGGNKYLRDTSDATTSSSLIAILSMISMMSMMSLPSS